jgi:hypothetical protein
MVMKNKKSLRPKQGRRLYKRIRGTTLFTRQTSLPGLDSPLTREYGFG